MVLESTYMMASKENIGRLPQLLVSEVHEDAEVDDGYQAR
jgi:hypothetical protein